MLPTTMKLALLALVLAVLACAVFADGSDSWMETGAKRREFSSMLTTARGFGKRSPLARMQQQQYNDNVGVEADVLLEEALRRPRLVALLVAALDADGDGVVTPDEVLGRLSRVNV